MVAPQKDRTQVLVARRSKRLISATVALCNKSAGRALYTLQSATPAHRTSWVKIENFDQERVFRIGSLRQWSASSIF